MLGEVIMTFKFDERECGQCAVHVRDVGLAQRCPAKTTDGPIT